jgi:hypothetical protein
MRGKKTRYTFVIEFLGGTYVHQGSGESPELALREYLRFASEDDDWTAYRVDLLRALADEIAVPIEGCRNVWCISGFARDYLFLIHIVATETGAGEGKAIAEAQFEQMGVDPKRWGWGDRW